MIANMKKISMVTIKNHKRETLKQLRSLGIMHLSLSNKKNERLNSLIEERNFIMHVLNLLPTEKADPQLEILSDEAINRLGNEVLSIHDEQRDARDEIERIQRDRHRILEWGDFNPQDIKELTRQNVHIKLYSVTQSEIEDIRKVAQTFVISEGKNRSLVAAVFLNEDDIPKERRDFLLPERSAQEMAESIHAHRKRIEEIDNRINEIAAYRRSFERRITSLKGIMEFERAEANMMDEEDLAYINGFIPEETLSELKQEAKENGWALLIEEPGPDDPVPTLIKNPRWISIIQPVFNMMGTVPGYYEFDISVLFLMFLSIFFGMIVGDGGYGLIFFSLPFAIFVKKRIENKEVPPAIILLMVFAVFTIIWGAITGTWFGHEEFADNSFLSIFVIKRIDSFNPRSSETVQKLCFILGTVHIAIAHFWGFLRDLKKKPRIKAFAQFGWLVAVLGLYYVVLYIVLSPTEYPIPTYALVMVLSGIVAVVLFAQQEGDNFFKGVLRGIGGIMPTFLDSIGAFSDIISYIRLFAVGLATVEIAKSFNQMAAGAGEGVIGVVAGILIIFLGHGLNLIMASLSVVVHGVRLNMLEFSSHLGMEWTGIAYKPFEEPENGQ